MDKRFWLASLEYARRHQYAGCAAANGGLIEYYYYQLIGTGFWSLLICHDWLFREVKLINYAPHASQ